jgi:hypothetical protein
MLMEPKGASGVIHNRGVRGRALGPRNQAQAKSPGTDGAALTRQADRVPAGPSGSPCEEATWPFLWRPCPAGNAWRP